MPISSETAQSSAVPGSSEVNQTTTISRAHKIKLKPNRAQENYFKRACGTRRFAYNWAWRKWNDQYELHKQDPELHEKPSKKMLQQEFRKFKYQDNYAWINEVSVRVSERGVDDLCTAWNNFFKALKRGDRNFRRPRPAAKGVRERFYVHNCSLRFDDTGKHLNIERLGPVRCRENLRFNGKIMSGTVSKAADGWYISVQVEVPHVVKPHPSPGKVGIDMGVANLVSLSDGYQFEQPMEQIRKLRKRLRREQKSLSRKWSGRIKRGHADKALRDEEGNLRRKSNNFIKQIQRVGRLHQRIARVREDGLHKLSRWIVDNYDLIAIEDLSLKNMTGSAKGTLEVPGRNVRAKSGLNRELLNASLRQLRILLEYKAEAGGGYVAAVDPAYTSQTCSACWHQCPENRTVQAVFKCVQCHHMEHADINAAKVILIRFEKGGSNQ